jgi:hypothetical protein
VLDAKAFSLGANIVDVQLLSIVDQGNSTSNSSTSTVNFSY